MTMIPTPMRVERWQRQVASLDEKIARYTAQVRQWKQMRGRLGQKLRMAGIVVEKRHYRREAKQFRRDMTRPQESA